MEISFKCIEYWLCTDFDGPLTSYDSTIRLTFLAFSEVLPAIELIAIHIGTHIHVAHRIHWSNFVDS